MDESRRLSYRNRKKLGLTFSEAFVEAPASPQARSVDRGYASVMSSATPGQGDTQSEWDERHARIENRDGLSRLMDDLNKKDEAEAASEEIFVGEGGMKEAMLYGFIDELEKLGVLEDGESNNPLLEGFLDELAKTAGPMDAYRAKKVMAAGKAGKGEMLTAGRGRAKGIVRSWEGFKRRGGLASSGMTAEEALQEEAKAQHAQQLLQGGGLFHPIQGLRNRRSLRRLARQGARSSIEETKAKVSRGADIQRARSAGTEMLPAADPAKLAPTPVADPAAAQQAAAQAAAQQQAAALTAGATPPAAQPGQGWLGKQWSAFSQPIAEGWQRGGVGNVLGGIGQGIWKSPAVGLPAAGLAGMALLPPALRAIGLGQREQHGVVPGMVSV
jgi:hypothetical protein